MSSRSYTHIIARRRMSSSRSPSDDDAQPEQQQHTTAQSVKQRETHSPVIVSSARVERVQHAHTRTAIRHKFPSMPHAFALAIVLLAGLADRTILMNMMRMKVPLSLPARFGSLSQSMHSAQNTCQPPPSILRDRTSNICTPCRASHHLQNTTKAHTSLHVCTNPFCRRLLLSAVRQSTIAWPIHSDRPESRCVNCAHGVTDFLLFCCSCCCVAVLCVSGRYGVHGCDKLSA